MGSKRRLSKKQLKQDKFVSTTFELARFFQENLRKTVIYLIAVAVVVGAVLYYLDYRSHKEMRAARLLWSGQVDYDSQNYPLAISDLEKVRKDFTGTKIGDEAMYMLAEAYYQEKKYKEAEDALKEFDAEYDTRSPMSYQAHELLGCILEDQNSFVEAAAAYIRASESARFDYQRVKARLDAARAYSMADDTQKALEECRFILDNYPDAQEAGEAALLKAEIQASSADGLKMTGNNSSGG
jgi:outer membrane protein assembly factor BamD (BamD/ComL family)